MKRFFFLPLIALLASFSCNEKETDNPGTVSNGYVKGRVVNGQGDPIKDVSILIDNTLIYNSYLTGSTDADGRYSIKLLNGGWMAYAEMNVVYNAKTYRIDLHPENTAGFGVEGAVRNFTWKLTGEKPTPLSGFYGGTIILDKSINSTIYDSENIEFTLTPVGKLIDGSDGEVIRMHHGQPTTDTYGLLRDLPIGRYKITAVYKSGGADRVIRLRNKLTNGTYATELQFDFEPSSSVGSNMGVLEYLEQ